MKITDYSHQGFKVLENGKETDYKIKDYVEITTKHRHYVGTLRMLDNSGITITCNQKSSVSPGCYIIPLGTIVSISKM